MNRRGQAQARGLLITFEGLDRTGKSTQARELAAYLRALGLCVVHTREPGGTRVGRRIRALLLSPRQEPLAPVAELLLLLADRAQHVERVVRPALAGGAVVVCERFADSSVAYQAYGLGLERGVVDGLNRLATGGLVPDLTFLIDLPPAERYGRPGGPRGDRIESRDAGFFERVRQGYLALAAEEPQRIVVIDARGRSRKEVHGDVVQAVHRRLGSKLEALPGYRAGGRLQAAAGGGRREGVAQGGMGE